MSDEAGEKLAEGYTLRNFQTGETWLFPTEDALLVFLNRRQHGSLAGSAAPVEVIEGWPGEKEPDSDK